MRFSVLLLCSNLLLLAQTAPDKPEKGLLEGKVLNSVTGEPVRKAQVALMNMSAAPKGKQESPGGGSALTDAAGGFEFTALASGNYALVASREGFDSSNVHGEPKLLRVTLAAGERKRDIVIRLAPTRAGGGGQFCRRLGHGRAVDYARTLRPVVPAITSDGHGTAEILRQAAIARSQGRLRFKAS